MTSKKKLNEWLEDAEANNSRLAAACIRLQEQADEYWDRICELNKDREALVRVIRDEL